MSGLLPVAVLEGPNLIALSFRRFGESAVAKHIASDEHASLREAIVAERAGGSKKLY